jgi:hypothetical protein
MRPDARVQYPQTRAPIDENLAKAIIGLCDGFAKGDSDKVKSLLAQAAQADLDSLVSSGDWEESTKRIEAVRVIYSSEMPGDSLPSSGGQIVLAFQEPDGSYIVGFNALNNNGTWVFDGMGTTPGKKARATEWDGLTIDDLTRATALNAPAEASAAGPAGLPADETQLLWAYATFSVAEKIATAAGVDPTAMAQMAGQQVDPAQIAAMKTAGAAIVEKGTKLPPDLLVQMIDLCKLASAANGNKVTEDQIFGFAAEVLKDDAARLKDEYQKAKSGGPATGPGGG